MDAKALQETLDRIRQEMADGELDDTFDAFLAFTDGYPADAWLNDYRSHGGSARDDDAYAVERAVWQMAWSELEGEG